MSTVLRLLLWGGLIAAVVVLTVHPLRVRRIGRQIRLVGFVYVVAVLISAALRLLGIINWS
jgi:hypothetical protein